MGRKKKISFKLNPEWMFKEPIDFEYNKYTLLDYLQKCEKGFDKMEIYPDFVELSLHLANLQSIVKDSLESVLTEEDENEMGDNEYEIRSIIDKIIGYSSVGAALAIVPAAMFISGGIAAALGVYALASNTLRDAAWFKRKGYDKYQSGHHYGKSDKSRNNR